MASKDYGKVSSVRILQKHYTWLKKNHKNVSKYLREKVEEDMMEGDKK
jgi:hypothetical protein